MDSSPPLDHDVSETEFYLVLEAPANKKQCVRLDPGKPWTEDLRERTMLEFLRVLVTVGMQGDEPWWWEDLPDERRSRSYPWMITGSAGAAAEAGKYVQILR